MAPGAPTVTRFQTGIIFLYSGASTLADQYFSKGNGARVHTLATIGNCHIDSAWLWPYSETKRKVARSFSAQLKLMEDYPELIFVASQVGPSWPGTS